MNPETFKEVPSNTWDLATSRFIASPPSLTATYLDNVMICSYNCLIIVGLLGCWLISYGGGGDGNSGVRGSGVGNDCS